MTVPTAPKDLSNTNALCVGASSGIGAGIAVQFAKQGASITIIGRDEPALKNVIATARAAAPGDARMEYVVADLSTVAGIKAAVKNVQGVVGDKGVQYVVQTQGATPSGTFALNADGYDKNFAVQVLSRFAVPYLLATSGTLSRGGSVVSVCAPGGTSIDVTDLDFGRAHTRGEYGAGLRHIPKAGNRDSCCVDAFTLEFASHFPGISAAHVFPGFVAGTQALRHMPMVGTVAGLLAAPLAAVGILHTPATYAHVPVDLAAARAEGLIKSVNTPVTPSAWMSDKANRSAIWNELEKMLK